MDSDRGQLKEPRGKKILRLKTKQGLWKGPRLPEKGPTEDSRAAGDPAARQTRGGRSGRSHLESEWRVCFPISLTQLDLTWAKILR